MSNRFGRQQKRKMRAALEQAMGKVRVLDKALGFSRQTVAVQDGALSTARRLIGHYCAALPLKSKEFTSADLNYYETTMRVHIPGPVVAHGRFDKQQSAYEAVVALRKTEALVVKFTVQGEKSFPLAPHKAVLRLHSGGDLAVLAITEDAFEGMTTEEAARVLAREFAELLVHSKVLKGII